MRKAVLGSRKLKPLAATSDFQHAAWHSAPPGSALTDRESEVKPETVPQTQFRAKVATGLSCQRGTLYERFIDRGCVLTNQVAA